MGLPFLRVYPSIRLCEKEHTSAALKRPDRYGRFGVWRGTQEIMYATDKKDISHAETVDRSINARYCIG